MPMIIVSHDYQIEELLASERAVSIHIESSMHASHLAYAPPLGFHYRFALERLFPTQTVGVRFTFSGPVHWRGCDDPSITAA